MCGRFYCGALKWSALSAHGFDFRERSGRLHGEQDAALPYSGHHGHDSAHSHFVCHAFVHGSFGSRQRNDCAARQRRGLSTTDDPCSAHVHPHQRLLLLGFERIVPWANHQFETIVRQIIFSEGVPVVQENVFFHGGDDRYFYIGEVQTKTNELKKVLVYDLGTKGFPSITTAQRGLFQDRSWVLSDGVYQELDEEGFVQFESRFQKMEITTEQEGEVYLGNQRTTDEMNRRELAEHIQHFQRGGLKVLYFVVDYHMKLALPMASFVFALFAAPLALLGKGGRSFGVVLSLVILLVYYVGMSVSRSMGVNEMLPPVVAAWLVNAFFALSGSILLVGSDRLR